MRRFRILLGRELRAFLSSPVTWALMTLAWLVFGLIFSRIVLPRSGGDLLRMNWDAAIQAIYVQILLVPLLTMRLVAEEKRSGTFEMLVTTPARDHEIVLAKFIAVALIHALFWAVLPLYALVLKLSGGDPDFGCVASAWVGVVGAGTLFAALGLFASAVSSHQIMAAFLGVVLILAFLFLPAFAESLPADWGTLRSVLAAGDLMRQTDQGARGLVDLVALTYQAAFTGLFLLFTVRVLEIRKWA